MTRGRRVAAGAAALMFASLGVAACGSDKSDPAFTQQTLRFTEQDTNDFSFIDNPPKTTFGKEGPEKLSNGDQLVFRAYLVDDAKKRVGALDATCMVTGAGNGTFEKANSTCHSTMTVPGGQLFVSVGGTPFATPTTTGAVTGGTGRYDGATGSFTSVGENRSKDTFHVWIPSR